MIEVQILTSDSDNQKWYHDCQEGLNSSVVNIHTGNLIDNNHNASRIAIWDGCGGDLLSFVRPSDIPVAAAWQKLQDAMDQNPKAMGAYTREVFIDERGHERKSPGPIGIKDPSISPLVAHHILVVRRSIYELTKPFLEKTKFGCEWLLAIAAYKRGGLIEIPMVGYKYRSVRNQRFVQNRSGSLGRGMKDDFIFWLNKQPSSGS